MRAVLLPAAILLAVAAPFADATFGGVGCNTMMCPAVDGDYWRGGGGSVIIGDTFRVWNDGRKVFGLGFTNCFRDDNLGVQNEERIKRDEYVPLPQCQATTFRCRDGTKVLDACYFCARSKYLEKGLWYYRVCAGVNPSDESSKSSPLPDLDRGSNAGTGPGGVFPLSSSSPSPSPAPSPSPSGGSSSGGGSSSNGGSSSGGGFSDGGSSSGGPGGNVVIPIGDGSGSSGSSSDSPSPSPSPSPDSSSGGSSSGGSSSGGSSSSESGRRSPSPDSSSSGGSRNTGGGCPDGSNRPECFNGIVNVIPDLPPETPIPSPRDPPPPARPICTTSQGRFRQLPNGSIASCTPSLFNWFCAGYDSRSVCSCRDADTGAVTQTLGSCRG